MDVTLGDGRWVTEGIVADVLGQDSLSFPYILSLAHANTQLLEFYIADATLAATIFELIWNSEAEFLSDHTVPDCIFWVSCQKRILLLRHLRLDWFV